MAVITEITLGYSRTNKTGEYQNENPTSFIKFSLESTDQNKKSVENIMRYGFGILLKEIDRASHGGAIPLSRKFTAKDQDGKSLPIPKGLVDDEELPPVGDEPPSEVDEDAALIASMQEKLDKIYAFAPQVAMDPTDKTIFYMCGDCDSPMYDNREENKKKNAKRKKEGKNPFPDFKCKADPKKHAIWPKKKKR